MHVRCTVLSGVLKLLMLTVSLVTMPRSVGGFCGACLLLAHAAQPGHSMAMLHVHAGSSAAAGFDCHLRRRPLDPRGELHQDLLAAERSQAALNILSGHSHHGPLLPADVPSIVTLTLSRCCSCSTKVQCWRFSLTGAPLFTADGAPLKGTFAGAS